MPQEKIAQTKRHEDGAVSSSETPASTKIKTPLLVTHRRWLAPALFVVVVAEAIFIVGTLARVAAAAEYAQPGTNPPSGNVPVTVWNALDLPSTMTVQQAAIAIDGGGPAPTKRTGFQVGNISLNLGAAAGGQNVYYGISEFEKMNDADYLMLLQAYKSATSEYANRFSVDRHGNVKVAGNLIVEGDVVSPTNCVGSAFVGLTDVFYNGALNGTGLGYRAAASRCVGQYGTKSHVCNVAEIMESLRCGKMEDAVLDGSIAWIQDGPPGYTAPAQDCMGWTSNATSYLGRIWLFDSVTGGKGYLSTCNQAIRFACCK